MMCKLSDVFVSMWEEIYCGDNHLLSVFLCVSLYNGSVNKKVTIKTTSIIIHQREF